jgi:hypothetical protein
VTESSNQGGEPAGDAARPRDTTPAGGTTPSGYAYTVVPAEGAAPAPAASPAVTSGRGLRWALLAAAGVVLVGVIGGLAWLALSVFTGDDGSNDDRLSADVASVVQAFTSSDGVQATRFEGELPGSYPGDVPRYPGSKVVSSVLQLSGDNAAYLAIFDSGDNRDDVAAYYDEQFDADPWQLDGGQSSADSNIRSFSKIDDANVSGAVLIAESLDDAVTTIIISVQVVSGAEDAEQRDFELPVSQPLPNGFPGDVAQYPDWVVLQAAFQSQPNGDNFALQSVTQDSGSTVLDFYRKEFEGKGWTVTDGDASQAQLEDAAEIRFESSDSKISGGVVTGVFGLDRDYTQVNVQVTQAE